MNLRQKYTEETGKDANRLPYQNICSVTIDYVEWLERQLRQYDVSGQSEQLKGEYTHHFIEWRDKYFEYNPLLVEWKTKKRNERYTTKQILSRYEKAMLKSPFNCR